MSRSTCDLDQMLFGCHQQASGIIPAGYLTTLLGRIARIHLNLLASCNLTVALTRSQQIFDMVDVKFESLSSI